MQSKAAGAARGLRAAGVEGPYAQDPPARRGDSPRRPEERSAGTISLAFERALASLRTELSALCDSPGAIEPADLESAFARLDALAAALHAVAARLAAPAATAAGHHDAQSAASDALVLTRPTAGYLELSPREREVFQLLAAGSSVGQIARRLHISVKTVSTHRAHILEKLHLENNAELTRYALEQGLA
jgi:DNA-binding CsgD family transcriptional regulator